MVDKNKFPSTAVRFELEKVILIALYNQFINFMSCLTIVHMFVKKEKLRIV